MVALGLVNSNTLTIVANDNTAEMVAEESRYGVSVGALDMDEIGALETENTCVVGTYIDNAFVILAEITKVEVSAIGKIALHLLTIVAQ